MEYLTQIGVGGLLAILMIREVLNFLAKRNANGKTSNAGVFDYNDRQRLNDLWNWHNKEDSEGVKVWYMRKSFEEAVARLADSIESLTEIQRAMMDTLKDMRRDNERHE